MGKLMGFFTKLNHKLVENRYKRKGLNIIQDIPTAQIQEVLTVFVDEGWELGTQYYNQESLIESGECAIRRGQSTLVFRWNESTKGSITGPERIIVSIANKHKLAALASPKIEL
jgi:hypothetical protein